MYKITINTSKVLVIYIQVKASKMGSDMSYYAPPPTLSERIEENRKNTAKIISKHVERYVRENNIYSSTKKLTNVIYFNENVYRYDLINNIFYLYHDSPKNPQKVDTKKIHIIVIDQDTNDEDTNDVYDKKSFDAGNPIKIGVVTHDNKLKKKMNNCETVSEMTNYETDFENMCSRLLIKLHGVGYILTYHGLYNEKLPHLDDVLSYVAEIKRKYNIDKKKSTTERKSWLFFRCF